MSTVKKMIYVGIDPGANTGIATWRPAGQVLTIYPAKQFWFAWQQCHQIQSTYSDAIFVVEDPNANPPIFPRKITGRKRDRLAQNVGMNKRDAKLWLEYFRWRGWNHKAVRPSSSKWSKEDLKRITGYTGRSSEHGRDAAKLVFGR